ncbi:MAG: hypothetical protein AABW59_00050 [archaeon]
MTTIIQTGLFLLGMGLGIATTNFIIPTFPAAGSFLWVIWLALALAGVFMIIKSKPPTGLFLLGMGLGVAAIQFIFPKLVGTPVEGFFWISWFILEIAGVILIIKGTEMG